METPNANKLKFNAKEQTVDDFISFKKEVVELQNIEQQKKSDGEKYNPHFDNLKPEDLNETDFEIYKKFKNRTLEKKEFLEYRKSFGDPAEGSRKDFMAYLANQTMNEEWTKRWDPEMYEVVYGNNQKE